MDKSSYAAEKLAELNVKGYTDLVSAFGQACESYGSDIAFHCLGYDLSFERLAEYSRGFATFLVSECHLKPGDRIAMQLPNLVQYPIVAWGALQAGVIIVNTNPMYTERELKHQLTDSGAKVWITLANLLPLAEKVVPESQVNTVILTSPMDMQKAVDTPVSSLPSVVSLKEALVIGLETEQLSTTPASLDAVAVLQYTGGTTGVPKGAVLTQGNLLSSGLMSNHAFGDTAAQDVAIAPMPLYHIYGFSAHVIAGVLRGSLTVLIPNPRDTDSLVAAMKQFSFTTFPALNTLFTALMQHPEFDKIDFSNAKKVVSGGTTLVEDIADEWERRTGSVIFEGYGLSETVGSATVNTPNSREIGTIGLPLKCVEVKVIDSEGCSLPEDEAGELCVRGPQVMQGYWNRPEATAEVLDSDGWLRTGDMAVIQRNGHVRIVDRIKDLILVSGFNVYPNEIENVVYGHPDVVECAAVGVPDAKSGEAVKLFIVSSNPALDQEEVIGFCRGQLTGYKIPRVIEFREELPKTSVGKILRRELRE